MVSQIMDVMDQRYVPEAAAPQYYHTSAEQPLPTTDDPGTMPGQEAHPEGLGGAGAGAAAADDGSARAAGAASTAGLQAGTSVQVSVLGVHRRSSLRAAKKLIKLSSGRKKGKWRLKATPCLLSQLCCEVH